MKSIIVAGALFLGACGFTSAGDALRTGLKAKGAEAMDQGLINAEWYTCQAASIGSVRRRYGKPGISETYREFCGVSGAAVISAPD